ncbi:unnamed protein product [Ascophyllum nodosum]
MDMLESKETAMPGLGRVFSSRHKSRVPLEDMRIGSDVLVNGTLVHIYDADYFTRRSIPDLLPPERTPCLDKTFSITPRRVCKEQYSPHHHHNVQGSTVTKCTEDGSSVSSPCPWEARMSEGLSPPWHQSTSAPGEDAPRVLRMFLRWNDVSSGQGKERHYILNYFLEDETIEMREIVDVRGGSRFQSRFPRFIRRQRAFKDGNTQGLGADEIGLDVTSPRWNKIKVSKGGSLRGGGSWEPEGTREPLGPQDLVVGRMVILMKRPMMVCGWDEASNAWWESVTGTSMWEIQEDLEDFRMCVNPQRSRPRPPNKMKPTFYEGPPQPPGTVRGRFLKASENNAKILRFRAKPTPDMQSPATRENDFIIKFYPEDETLSIYSSHHLGHNSGGAYRGVYLSRRGDVINEVTGEPFRAGDFCLGFVAKFPTVSLEIVDVDDFSRHYLAREAHPPDERWQTVPMWQKILRIVMGGGKNGCFHLSSQAAPPQDKAMDISPGVSFRDASDVGVSNSHPDRTVGADVLTPYSNNSAFESDDIVDRVAAGAGATAVAMFERLWAECIGDHAFFGSRNDRGARSTSPWDRLVGAMLNIRGVDVTKELTAHERMLLDREVADWWRVGGGAGERIEGEGLVSLVPAATPHEQQEGQPRSPRMSRMSPVASDRTVNVRLVEAKNARDFSDLSSFSSGVQGTTKTATVQTSLSGREPKCAGGVVQESSTEPTEEKKHNPALTAGWMKAMTAENGGDSTAITVLLESERPLALRAIALDAHEAPSTGREDRLVGRALKKLQFGVFGRGGEMAVRKALEAAGKSLGDKLNLLNMTWLLADTAGLTCHETEALWLKFMHSACAKAEDERKVTIKHFLEPIRAFEACLQKGVVLGLSNVGRS